MIPTVQIGECYGKTLYYSATLSFPVARELHTDNMDVVEEEEQYDVTIQEDWDGNSAYTTITVTFPDGLPEGVDEEEMRQLVEAKFNEL